MIHDLRIWAADRPLAAALAAFALIETLFLGPFLVFGGNDATDGTGIISYLIPIEVVIFEWAFVILALLIVVAYDWGRQSGIAAPADPAGGRALRWLAAYPVVIMVLVGLAIVAGHDPAAYLRPLLIIVALNIAVALFEEIMFRGILMHGLRARMSPFGALVGSSILFGLFHLTNALAGQNFDFTLFQVINAAALGLVLGAAYLQTNTLWAPVLLHFCWNMAGMMSLLLVDLAPDTISSDAQAQIGTVSAAQWMYPAVIAAVGIYTFLRWQRRVGPRP